jgi:hypothetical protein
MPMRKGLPGSKVLLPVVPSILKCFLPDKEKIGPIIKQCVKFSGKKFDNMLS